MSPTEYSYLVELHRAYFVRLAFRFFQDAELADDLAQDTLLRLWIGRERIASEADFLALGTRIAKNLCVNEWKRRKNHGDSDVSPPDRASQSDTAAELETHENEQLLCWAIRQLPRNEARLFRLWSEGAMNTQQMAAVLNIKPTTVSNTLSKVKRKIYQLILSRQ